MFCNQFKHGNCPLVQIIRWIAQMILGQSINIIGNASKSRDHCVLRAGGIELVGDVIIFKKIVSLVLCANQQFPLPIEAAHVGAKNLVKAEEVKIHVPCFDVYRPVRGIGYGIHADQGACIMDPSCDLFDIVDLAQNI